MKEMDEVLEKELKDLGKLDELIEEMVKEQKEKEEWKALGKLDELIEETVKEQKEKEEWKKEWKDFVEEYKNDLRKELKEKKEEIFITDEGISKSVKKIVDLCEAMVFSRQYYISSEKRDNSLFMRPIRGALFNLYRKAPNSRERTEEVKKVQKSFEKLLKKLKDEIDPERYRISDDAKGILLSLIRNGTAFSNKGIKRFTSTTFNSPTESLQKIENVIKNCDRYKLLNNSSFIEPSCRNSINNSFIRNTMYKCEGISKKDFKKKIVEFYKDVKDYIKDLSPNDRRIIDSFKSKNGIWNEELTVFSNMFDALSKKNKNFVDLMDFLNSYTDIKSDIRRGISELMKADREVIEECKKFNNKSKEHKVDMNVSREFNEFDESNKREDKKWKFMNMCQIL